MKSLLVLNFLVVHLLSLVMVPIAFAAGQKRSTNLIKDFKYTSCASQECIVLSAPKAWVSVLRGGFSTEGGATLKITDREGHEKSVVTGETASYSPDLEVITIEKSSTEFALYSIKDGRISFYGKNGGTK
jgi:hypothetical protein